MAFTPDADSVFRDHATPGVPADGPHAPVPSEIRSLFGNVEDRIEAAQADADAAAAAAAAAQADADAAEAAAIARGFLPGDYLLKGSLSAPTGWIAPGGYIGNTGSGASNRANADTWNLFNIWWVNTTMQMKDNTGTDVSRGASATVDFAAGHRMPVPVPDWDPTDPVLNWYVRL